VILKRGGSWNLGRGQHSFGGKQKEKASIDEKPRVQCPEDTDQKTGKLVQKKNCVGAEGEMERVRQSRNGSPRERKAVTGTEEILPYRSKKKRNE